MKPIKKEYILGFQGVLLSRRGMNEIKARPSREEVIGIVLSSIKKVNAENIENRRIKK